MFAPHWPARLLWRHAFLPSAQLAALAAGSCRAIHCSTVRPKPALHIPPVTTSASFTYSSSASDSSAPIASHSPFPSSRLSSIFTASHASHLRRYGFTVIDNALGDSYSAQLRDETLALKRNDLMEPNHTHLRTPTHTTLLPKRGIHEIDSHIPGLAAIAPAIHSLTTDLSLLRAMDGLLPTLGLHSQSVKVQYNEGDNACFPLHFDSYNDRGDNRRLTAILYLNPDWKARWGGQLELMPLPWERVRIEPRWDRLVVFATSGVLHRVRPSKHERLCVTLWMSGAERLQAENKEEAMSSVEAMEMDGTDAATVSTLRTLLSPRFYPHLVKLLSSDEWAASIEQSHHSSADTQAAIAQHYKDVELIERAIGAAVNTLPRGLLPVPVEEAGDAVRQMGGVEWGSVGTNGSAGGGNAVDSGVQNEVRAMQRRIRWDELHSFV